MYRCDVNVSEMITKGFQLSKEIELQSIRFCVACDRNGMIRTLSWTSPDTSAVVFRAQTETELVNKDLICAVPAQFQKIWHHHNWT